MAVVLAAFALLVFVDRRPAIRERATRGGDGRDHPVGGAVSPPTPGNSGAVGHGADADDRAPELAVDVGFALSVSATAALVVIAPVWSRRLVGRGWPKPLADAVSVAVAAQLVTAPLVAGDIGHLQRGVGRRQPRGGRRDPADHRGRHRRGGAVPVVARGRAICWSGSPDPNCGGCCGWRRGGGCARGVVPVPSGLPGVVMRGGGGTRCRGGVAVALGRGSVCGARDRGLAARGRCRVCRAP